MKKKQKVSNNHGTQEWAVKSVNCCTGCSHDCIYFYAKEMAIRFKQVDPDQWSPEPFRLNDAYKRHKKYPRRVMFPSSHDITDANLNACENVIHQLIEAGNQVIVVSKPHFSCIESLCTLFSLYSENILFRFTIGACDDSILSF